MRVTREAFEAWWNGSTGREFKNKLREKQIAVADEALRSNGNYDYERGRYAALQEFLETDHSFFEE